MLRELKEEVKRDLKAIEAEILEMQIRACDEYEDRRFYEGIVRDLKRDYTSIINNPFSYEVPIK